MCKILFVLMLIQDPEEFQRKCGPRQRSLLLCGISKITYVKESWSPNLNAVTAKQQKVQCWHKEPYKIYVTLWETEDSLQRGSHRSPTKVCFSFCSFVVACLQLQAFLVSKNDGLSVERGIRVTANASALPCTFHVYRMHKCFCSGAFLCKIHA